jgi:hypothetical protein
LDTVMTSYKDIPSYCLQCDTSCEGVDHCPRLLCPVSNCIVLAINAILAILLAIKLVQLMYTSRDRSWSLKKTIFAGGTLFCSLRVIRYRFILILSNVMISLTCRYKICIPPIWSCLEQSRNDRVRSVSFLVSVHKHLMDSTNARCLLQSCFPCIQ